MATATMEAYGGSSANTGKTDDDVSDTDTFDTSDAATVNLTSTGASGAVTTVTLTESAGDAGTQKDANSVDDSRESASFWELIGESMPPPI